MKTHVPLFVEGWDDDGEYDEMVGLTDIPVTLAEAVGLDIPDNYFGHSLRRLVFDGEWDRTAVFGSYVDGNDELHSHVRTAEWNLAVHGDDEDELYHLTEDPGEQENVVGQFTEDEAELRDRLDEHRQLVKSTERDDIVRPDMNEDVKERLRRLGYNE